MPPHHAHTRVSLSNIEFITAASGMRYHNRDDLLLLRWPKTATVAGVFTQSHYPAAPVSWSRKLLQPGQPNPCGLMINAGVANAMTGSKGTQNCYRCAELAANYLNCKPEAVLLASTGVIGEQVQPEQIAQALAASLANHQQSGAQLPWQQLTSSNAATATAAINTTDTRNKVATYRYQHADRPVNFIGFAKGSGMIAPNMATMLAWIGCDAAISSEQLRYAVHEIVATNFNNLTIDGDTSTNDCVFVVAQPNDQVQPLPPADLPSFYQALEIVCQDLVAQLASDGEGASKQICISITGAKSNDHARQVALSIANSPLVKTALAAGDANWGRIAMAIGKTSQPLSVEQLNLTINEIPVVIGGLVAADYNEAQLTSRLQQQQVNIAAKIGSDDGTATVWSCDLTAEYIRINGEYRS